MRVRLFFPIHPLCSICISLPIPIHVLILIFTFLLFHNCFYKSLAADFTITDIPFSSTNWVQLTSSSITQFSGRNAHATCVFRGKIWLTGGRTDSYTTYNLVSSTSVADVWYSSHGDTWLQVEELKGDYFAQNTDVVQPGNIAPWYPRYGHSLDSIDIDGDGLDDYMVLAGGYAPDPSNDLWLTSDGITWVYSGIAPWSSRAWHSTSTFQGKLWILGGSPLNNEVWTLDSVQLVPRSKPLTRSMYMNYTFEVDWKQYPNAAWSPRVGAGAVSHWYFNKSVGQTIQNSVERLVIAGGYGGWLSGNQYYGYHCQNDVWITYDGLNWTIINSNASFSERAWFGMAVLSSADPRQSISPPFNDSADIFIVGGGNIGFSTVSNQRIVTMDGKLDCFRSRDGVSWNQTNFQEGGGTSGIFLYSSQEWSKTVVNSAVAYLGMWGMTLEAFNSTDGTQSPSNLFLIAGSKTGQGGVTNAVYKSREGLFCDLNGIACNGNGVCRSVNEGCSCNPGYSGVYCEESSITTSSASIFVTSFTTWLSTMIILCLILSSGR